MQMVATIMSAAFAGLGVVGVLWPDIVLGFARDYFTTPSGLFAAAGIRVVFGGILLTAAQTSRAPNLLRVCGAIIAIAGLATPWFGVERTREVLAAADAAGGAGMRIACTVAVALGSSFVWALSPRGAPRPR